MYVRGSSNHFLEGTVI